MITKTLVRLATTLGVCLTIAGCGGGGGGEGGAATPPAPPPSVLYYSRQNDCWRKELPSIYKATQHVIPASLPFAEDAHKTKKQQQQQQQKKQQQQQQQDI